MLPRDSTPCVPLVLAALLEFTSVDQVEDHQDAYFGILYVGGGDFPYLWHCSHWQSNPVTARQRGANGQLVGTSTPNAHDSRSKLPYPGYLALERDQGAHNM